MENELLKNDTEINNIFDNIKELVINSRCCAWKIITKINKWIWQRIFQKKFRKNEKILYLFSNCDNSVVAIKLVPLPRTN